MKGIKLLWLLLLLGASARSAESVHLEEAPVSKAAHFQASLLKVTPLAARRSAPYFENTDVVEIAVFKFHATPREVPAESEIRAVLADPESLQVYTQKRCEFNANYALTWMQEGKRFDVLLCFGCAGVQFHGGGEHLHYDLSRSAADVLQARLVELVGRPAPAYAWSGSY